jgi:hypothetical protein
MARKTHNNVDMITERLDEKAEFARLEREQEERAFLSDPDYRRDKTQQIETALTDFLTARAERPSPDPAEVEAARAEFRTLRRNSGTSAMPDEWMAAVRAELTRHGIDPTEADHAQWVEAARNARTECDRCHGSGLFCWGAIVNGVPTHQGMCFRCEGRGTQGQADYRRNFGHNMNLRVY